MKMIVCEYRGVTVSVFYLNKGVGKIDVLNVSAYTLIHLFFYVCNVL